MTYTAVFSPSSTTASKSFIPTTRTFSFSSNNIADDGLAITASITGNAGSSIWTNSYQFQVKFLSPCKLVYQRFKATSTPATVPYSTYYITDPATVIKMPTFSSSSSDSVCGAITYRVVYLGGSALRTYMSLSG